MIVPYTPLTGASTPLWIAIKGSYSKNTDSMSLRFYFCRLYGYCSCDDVRTVRHRRGRRGGAVVLNRFGGGDLITIGAQTGVYTTDCFARPEIKSVRELKGRTIGVTRFGTSTHFAGLSILRLAGLKPGDIRLCSNRWQLRSHPGALQRQTGRGDAGLPGQRCGSKKRLSSTVGSCEERRWRV